MYLVKWTLDGVKHDQYCNSYGEAAQLINAMKLAGAYHCNIRII